MSCSAWRPGLGTLVGEAGTLQARLENERGPTVPGPSALTAAELRLLPLLGTHLSFPEIGAELFLCRTPSVGDEVDLPQAGASHGIRRSRGPVS